MNGEKPASPKPDLYRDNLWKLMVRMSLPGILGMMLISVNSVIDAVYVGQFLGEAALAGVSLALPLTVLTTALTAMIASGSASVLSRAIGARDVPGQSNLLSAVLTLTLVASVVLSVTGYFLADTLLSLMGGKEPVAGYGARYYRTLISGAFFSVLGVSTNGLIRAEGRVGRAMGHLAIALLTNVLATPLLILGFDLDTAGAALGTVLSMTVYTLVNLHYFASGKASFYAGKLRICWQKEIFKAILSVGLSGLLIQLTQFIRQLFIFKSMSYYGTTDDIAFLGAVFRIFMFSVMPVFGMVQAMQPVTGINFGAENFGRSVKSVKVFRAGSILLLLLITLPSLLFPKMVLSTMLPGTLFSPKAIFHFRIMMLAIPFTALASTGITFFQAIGEGKTAGLLPLLRNLLLFVPLILLWPSYKGPEGIYYTICAENILFAGIVYFYTRTRFTALLLKSSTSQKLQ